MSERSSWTGCAADLLQVSLEGTGQIPMTKIGWPKNPRALAGRLRRAQTFLRAIGIEVAFSRQGRAGNRVIKISSCFDETVGTVGTVSNVSENATQPQGSLAGPGWRASAKSADDADGVDGADAKASFRFGQSG